MMTDARLSVPGALTAASPTRWGRAVRGPNPESMTLTADGAILRYKPEDIGTYKGVEFFAQEVEWEVGRDGEEIQYPYVDGQTEEDTGRLPWRGTILTRFFGVNWLQRCENFIGVIEARSEPGDLQLPGGFARFNAKIRKGKVRKLAGRGGCEMTLTFCEISYSAYVYMYDAASSPATQAQDLVPDGMDNAQAFVDSYADSVRDPYSTADDNLAALDAANDALDEEEQEVDGDTPEGQADLDRLALCRARMNEAFPDQDYLEESGAS
jgi:hypothetical protein